MTRLDYAPERDHTLLRSTTDVETDQENGFWRLRYDPSVDDTSLAVVSAVSAASRTDPTELEPLHDAVDTSALDSLFAPSEAGGCRENVRIAFEFSSFEVSIESGGIVEVSRRQCI